MREVIVVALMCIYCMKHKYYSACMNGVVHKLYVHRSYNFNSIKAIAAGAFF